MSNEVNPAIQPSDEIVSFIEAVRWTYAKTMPQWPHHYIVRNNSNEGLFVRLAEHIRKFGYEGRFYDKAITYFDHDGLVYWTMGSPVDETTIINRARKEDTYERKLLENRLPRQE